MIGTVVTGNAFAMMSQQCTKYDRQCMDSSKKVAERTDRVIDERGRKVCKVATTQDNVL